MHEIVDEHMIERILGANEELAAHNRQDFDEDELLVINFMSAPGAGKTSLLEATIPRLKPKACGIIEGDMVGELDAERLRVLGVPVRQICTGRSCHLDAQMVARSLHAEPLPKTDYLFIENVGNLVCPAEFNLGEHKRVVLLSVTEGDDKPIKYPVIFRNCDAVVFTKTDLLPYVKFSIARCMEHIMQLNHSAKFFCTSVSTNVGMDEWIQWLETTRTLHRQCIAI